MKSQKTKLSRREIVQYVALASILPACAPKVRVRAADRALESLLLQSESELQRLLQLPESAHFPMGVSSGDPGPHSLAFSTFWEGTQMTLKLHLRTEGASDIATHVVQADDAGYVAAEISNLIPETNYHWMLTEWRDSISVARSPVGFFRTAPTAQSRPKLRFAAVACTMNLFEKITLSHAATHGPFDAFLLLGDSSYNDGARTLSALRGRWKHSFSSEGWQEMRRVAPVVATWDDHEFENNLDPETVDREFFENARKAFFEVMPMRRDAPNRLWRKLSFGETADVFVLDCRTERKPSTRNSESPIYLSFEQMNWLKKGLKESRARFKLLMNSVPMGEFPALFTWFSKDRWEGFYRQRLEILKFIDDEQIPGVLWVSGDFHLASLGKVARSGPGATQTEILVGPGAQIGNGMAGLLQPPQFQWASSESNTTILELDPAAGTIRCTWLGAEKVLHEETLALN